MYGTKQAAKLIGRSFQRVTQCCRQYPDRKELWYKMGDGRNCPWIITDKGIEFLKQHRNEKWS